MAKFRYYVTDTMNGMVFGTDDSMIAGNCQLSQDYFVVDSDKGIWLMVNGDGELDSKEIEELQV